MSPAITQMTMVSPDVGDSVILAESCARVKLWYYAASLKRSVEQNDGSTYLRATRADSRRCALRPDLARAVCHRRQHLPDRAAGRGATTGCRGCCGDTAAGAQAWRGSAAA